MEKQFHSFATLTDRELLARVKSLAAKECDATADLIASLAELDERRLYLAEGFPSLFVYCVRVLHLTEHAAYNRIEVARTARQWPIIFQMIAHGSVTLTAVRLLSASLTDANHRELLDAATHKTKSEVEELLAARSPQPRVPSIIRKLPAPAAAAPPPTARRDSDLLTPAPATLRSPGTGGESSAPIRPRRPAIIAPLAPERYTVQMTVTRETHDKLRRVQDLLRHQVADGDPAVVFDRALTLLLQELERRKLASTCRPRPARAASPGSRHIPASVRREVWKRDGGQCAFEGHAGRCSERGFIEFHHVVPFADGGATTAANLQLRCRAHNAYEAEMHFGPLLVRERSATYSSFQNEFASWHISCAGLTRSPTAKQARKMTVERITTAPHRLLRDGTSAASPTRRPASAAVSTKPRNVPPMISGAACPHGATEA
jgi:hypothetical protein